MFDCDQAKSVPEKTNLDQYKKISLANCKKLNALAEPNAVC